MGKNVLVLKQFEAPKEAGVYHRLVCLTGATKGESYALVGNRIIIGRSEKADIRLNDTKTSREHLEISKVGEKWVATDLGSQNGVVINDAKITQKQLSEGDKIIVGQTVFKFAKVEVASKNKSKDEPVENTEKSKSFLPLILIVGVLGFFFLSDDKKEEPKKSTTRKETVEFQNINDDLTTAIEKRQANENKQIKEKLSMIYQRGLRELREKNYYRAIHEFNLALIIAPSDAQAEYYLRKTKEELDKEIEGYTATANRDANSLKYKSAVISYCAITRLLYSVPDDPRYKNAVEQIKQLELKLGQEQGETDCLKKQRTVQ